MPGYAFRRDTFADMFEPIEPRPLSTGIRVLLSLWCIFLPFWLLLSLGAAAFRTTVGGNLFVASWGLPHPTLDRLRFLAVNAISDLTPSS